MRLPPGWQKPSSSFAAREKRQVPWDGCAPTSPGPNTGCYSTLNNGSQRAALQKPSFSRAKRFSESGAGGPGPADYATTPRSRALGHSAAAAAIGYATCIELPWERREADANPAPGAYTGDIVESKKQTRSPASTVYKSRSPRFRGEVERSPGAAAYSPRGHEMANLSDSLALKTSAVFVSESARELQLITGEINPTGPGQYDGFERLSLSADMARSARLKSASFDSLSPRFRPPPEGGPGPSDYSPRKKTEHPTTHAYSIHASF